MTFYLANASAGHQLIREDSMKLSYEDYLFVLIYEWELVGANGMSEMRHLNCLKAELKREQERLKTIRETKGAELLNRIRRIQRKGR
jgi:hypothetical protein